MKERKAERGSLAKERKDDCVSNGVCEPCGGMKVSECVSHEEVRRLSV